MQTLHVDINETDYAKLVEVAEHMQIDLPTCVEHALHLWLTQQVLWQAYNIADLHRMSVDEFLGFITEMTTRSGYDAQRRPWPMRSNPDAADTTDVRP